MFNKDESKERFRSALMLLLRFYPKGRRGLFEDWPKLKTAHKLPFPEETPEQAAFVLARHVLASTIERTSTPEQRVRIRAELAAISTEEIERMVRETFLNAAPTSSPSEFLIATYLVGWALMVAQDMQKTGTVSELEFSEFMDEVYGALDGKTASERLAARVGRLAHNAFELPVHRIEENEPLLETREGPAEFPPLAGREVRVKLQPTALGVALVEENSQSQITERRNLGQNLLQGVPLDRPPYQFVNVLTDCGDQCSCLVYGPDNEVVGDMRAFWWSLAKGNVFSADLNLSMPRFSVNALGVVAKAARGGWDEAMARDDIESLRDMPMYRRNVHFEALNGIARDASHPLFKIGFEIALAMVLAVQSEDRRLERHAFLRFREFLWLPGEEPREFLEHLATGPSVFTR